MAGTFVAGPQAVLDCRRHAAPAMAAPSARFNKNLAFRQAARGNALQWRSPMELRAQRAAVLVTRAAAEEAEEEEYEQDEFEERVVQVRRVTKVVKGGKQLSFRAVVVVGDQNGTVGVGCDSAKEVAQAVRKAVTNAKRNLVTVPLTKNFTFPHRYEAEFKAGKVMLRPAAEGTGVIAGGAVRVVLELAGVKNGFGKQLGSGNPLTNARTTIEGLKNMRTYEEVAAMRGIPVSQLMERKAEAAA